MVTPRPLKLKAQVGSAGKNSIASVLPVARVWVDSGIFHLDTPFDYWVPENLDELAREGVRVQVEFGNSVQEGIVIERCQTSPNASNLKHLLKVLSPHPVATTETLELFRLVARRWAGSPYDIIRSAIPPRAASVDKENFSRQVPGETISGPDLPLPPVISQIQVRTYWALPPSVPVPGMIGALIATRAKHGQVLLIAPDERELLAIENELLRYFPKEEIGRLDGHILRADRYRNFLRFTKGALKIALGLRGAIFAPLEQGATIIVLGESSELLHEPRSPGWNARDVALMRASQTNVNIIFVGFTPSLEVARLIDTGWLSFISSKVRRPVLASPQSQGELLPSKAFEVVRKALKTGAVLFLVPRKGYGNAVLCQKCRNIALCSCGGRLEQTGAGADPRCVLCFTRYPSWHCSWCQGGDIYIAARGIDRFTEEIGRSFPNYPLINSSGEHIVDFVPSVPSLVVATPGAQPRTSDGYAAVALLEGVRFFGHTDLRSTENTREHFFESASLASPTGAIFLALDSGHPIVAALSRWDSSPMIRRELEERANLSFPPYFRFICLDLDSKQASALHAGLLQAAQEERIPHDVHITGPHEKSNQISRITLAAPISQAQLLVDFLHELQRRRSLSHKSLFTIRIDPYSLT